MTDPESADVNERSTARYRDYGVSDGCRRALVRWVVVPSWVLLGFLVVTFAVVRATGVSVPPSYRYAPFLVSIVVFGLPHGAVDHLVPARLRDEKPDLVSVGRVMAVYTVLVVMYAVVWFVAPGLAFVFFIGLTLYHWGQGDLHASLGFLRTNLGSRLGRAVTLVSRGSMPMLVPLLAFPEEYRDVADAVIRVFDPRGAETIAFAFEPAFRFSVGVFLVVFVSATVYLSRSSFEAGELALLGVYFATVPPILAVGFYFCFWHSTRHIGRLIALDPVAVSHVEDGNATRALLRFGRDAAPLTAGAVVIFAALWLVASPPATVEGFFALYLILLAALTLPHAGVVTLMDRVQRVW
ncbi:Brp/Blh family beta-carotene 15,15'-dioxygenase [Haladaptatus sp. F3-133]|jgi:Brp/Blh family beta-carotene 15,15'-monooxygenase|uniref:Probable beta-carotene 15,15'-dioxygenase n=1 Tax=Halorutilus salinus TaxID=2487751 RepID=A0A9Q4GJ14_9EURY|nr:Brp/Blh family beta-carotene 15,15'-dioxygenase [Halorutilus salinus]MCX2818796.1 Brp/Blh family beta-carotene 15,15'-dioxygenase [Halorutilus salinus]